MRVAASAVRKAVSSSAERMAYGVPYGLRSVRDPTGVVLSVDFRDGGGRKERLEVLVLGVLGLVGVCDVSETVEEREAREADVEEVEDEWCREFAGDDDL